MADLKKETPKITIRNLIFALVLTLFVGASVGAPVTVSVTGELLIKTAQAKKET